MHDQIIKQVHADIWAYGMSEYKVFDSVRGIFTEDGASI
jgi:hypothetical protein